MVDFQALAAHAPGFSSDSRQVQTGDIFVALKGEKSDGHDFVPDLLKKNPSAVIVRTDYPGTDPRLHKVNDTHVAHRALAAAFRAKFGQGGGKVIAIGGSSGKTSTKEFLFTLLSAHFKCIKTQASQNGELGIPKTLEQLRPGVQVAVIEVGIDAPGDMVRHAALVAPDVALLTSIGEEHLNLLKNVETVFQEERELFEATWKRGGHGFAPANDAYLARLKGHKHLTLTPSQDPALKSALTHPLALQNLALAAAVARSLGVPEATLQSAAAGLKMPEGRAQEISVGSGLLIADHYNSNPSSLRAGLRHAATSAQRLGQPLLLVLGDMFDLGEATAREHQGVVADIVAAKPAQLWLVGAEMSALAKPLGAQSPQLFSDSSAAAQAVAPLKSSLQKGAVLLLKGSRGMKMERILEALSKS